MVINMIFYKYEGTGNDFIITEDKCDKDILKLCDRHYGIGADGLIIIDNIESIIKMKIYNSDGSEANTCGNGLRCVGAYLKDRYNKINCKIQTISDVYDVEYIDDEYRVFFPLVKSIKRKDNYYIVNSGNHHIITINNSNFEQFINEIREKYDCNIENVVIHSRNYIEIKVYERGVGFTLACGSGAIACVSALYQNNLVDNNVVCKMDGGDIKVCFSNNHIYLQGKANLVYRGYIND